MRELFNDGWKFSKIHIENKTNEDGSAIIYDSQDFYSRRPDSKDFSPVTVPHDWMIFNAKDLYENSVGFYQKDFDLAVDSTKRFFLRFGGVYMNWSVWINGQLAGIWKYGYSTVEFEITPFVKNGKNVVELIAVYQSPNSRWYSGAGIFRDVELITTPLTRICNDGIYFVAKPAAEKKYDGKWAVEIQTEISKPVDGMKINHQLIFADGSGLEFADSKSNQCESKILSPAMGECFDGDEKILVDNFSALVDSPKLWDSENPNVYILKTTLEKDGQVLDVLEKQVGFKEAVFTTDNGLIVNGKNVEIKGACEHHDFGALGAAFDLVAARRKFLKLKEMGVNAIRTSHNPQDTKYLDLADRMGFYIDSECFDMWEKPKTTYDYGNYFVLWHERDCAAQIRRDRCHPSLIMWSIGNEIYDTHSGNGFAITQDLARICREHDFKNNAAVTIASNYMEWDGAQKCAEKIDVVGYNYLERLYEKHHEKNPHWKIYGSETSSTVQSRGIYHFPYSNRLLTCMDNQCSSLGNCSTTWGAKNTDFVVTTERDTEFSAGQFIWTGWDYIGEPTPYNSKNSFFGQIDTAGFPKDTFYIYKSVWAGKKSAPFVHLLPYWDFNEGQKIDLRIYSNLENVELILNGKSLGRKTIDLKHGKDLSAMWENVTYEKGSVVAVGYDSDWNEVCREEKKSFGDPCSLAAAVEKESADGLYFIDVSSFDAEKNPVENSRSRIEITVDGDAVLVGADNGDSTDYEEYRSSDGKSLSRKLFSNKLMVMVRGKSSHSTFSVTFASCGLECAVLKFVDGKLDEKLSAESSSKILPVKNNEIPVRKIELICPQSRELNPENRTVKVKAVVHPLNATSPDIKWSAMMREGVTSDCGTIEIEKSKDGEIGLISAASDGDFILTCTASNSSPYSEIISELEFFVSGVGRATMNPYSLIEGCKCSQSLDKVVLSFNGGAFTQNERTWFMFDKVDFGKDGADTFSVPIFSFDTELDFEIWEGNPDNGEGKKLMDCHYSSPSIYNTYQANTYVLPRRLFGVHNLTLVFKSGLSVQGFVFEKSSKAFAKLNALDCSSVVGDSFTKTDDGVTGIGNNVVLEFDAMDFGDKKASSITICGLSHVDNTIHVKFSGANGDVNRIVEFKKTDGYEEKTFDLEGVDGMNKVSFVFLPGSNFDFKWFKFNPSL